MRRFPCNSSKLVVGFLLLSLTGFSSANSSTMPAVPSPFFFTENKGQWDARVLYKCQAKNGMTWFLERDGITLLVSREQGTGNGEQWEAGRGVPQNCLPELEVGHSCPTNINGETGRGGSSYPPADPERRTFLSDGVMDENLPEMLRRHPARYPMKSHALKFRFLKNGTRDSGFGDQGRGGLPRPPEQDNVRALLRDARTTGGISFRAPNPEFQTPCEAQSVEALGELPWKNNYFLGNDSSKWAPNCRNFSTVVYREVWDGIDIEWYENDGKLEFDFIVHSGFDPSQIRMSIEGLEGDRISGLGDQGRGGLPRPPELEVGHSCPTNGNREQGTGNSRDRRPCLSDEKENVRVLLRDARTTGGISSRTPSPESRTPNPRREPALRLTAGNVRGHELTELLLPTSLGELRTALPSVYQVSSNGSRSEVDAKFEIFDEHNPSTPTRKIFGITLPNSYDPDHSLRIDPLIYSTFLGGALDDECYGMCNDGSNGVLLTGITTSLNYPTAIGVIQPNYNGSDYDGFVTRLNSSGTQLLYSTYLGGAAWDYGNAIASDGSGSCVVTGLTNSASFPHTSGTLHGSADVFIVHLNSTGSQLLYGLLLGGSNYDAGKAVICDSNGTATITGDASLGFQTTPGAYQTTYTGAEGFEQAFVTQVSGTGTVLFSTFLGGVRGQGRALCESPTEGYYVTGQFGYDFPSTPGAYDTTYGGNGDIFVAHLNSNGTQVLFSTFFGDSGMDYGSAICTDSSGNIWIAGNTTSNNFPTSPGTFDSTFNGGSGSYPSDGYFACFDSTGSRLLYSTYFGGAGNDGVGSVFWGNNDELFVLGGTSSDNYPVTENAYDRSFNGSSDAFIAQFSGQHFDLTYSTFFGGNRSEGAIGFLTNGNEVTFGGSTFSSDLPVTATAFDPTHNGGGDFPFDCYVTRLSLEPDTNEVVQEPSRLPESIILYPAYPNPFNSSTTISYSLPKPGFVELRLFDITGREVATLVNQRQQTGSYRVTFDGKNLSSGTYFVRMQAGENFVKTQKMVLLR